MMRNPLRLAEGRILVEQLRLLMSNTKSSHSVNFPLAILMFFALFNDSNATVLKLWCAATLLSTLYLYFYARRHLVSGIPVDQAPRRVWELMVSHGVDGLLWGSLVWITLGTATPVGSVLVLTVITGEIACAMSEMSSVQRVFIAFAVPMLSVVILKLFLLGDPAYDALGVSGILYIFALLGHARNNARVARTSIELRFENAELVNQLRVEKSIAEDAREEAEQANLAKSKFLAAASHDLRQPIHAQGLFLDVLSRTALTAQQRELLACACATSEASAEMLNTLLDFSRIEADVIEPHVQAFRLQPLLNKIEREFAQQADEKGLAYRSRETAVAVQSDPALLELILRNLVSNAIRYTGRGGLLVACRKRGSEAVIEVWDSGIGIAREHQREIFHDFHQLGNPERDRRKGLGLGLAIAERLARTLKSSLSLDSTPGRGSVFRLAVPIAELQVEQADHAAILPGKPQLLDARILVIDDDETVRTGMRHLLLEWGCTCETAETVEEALVLARHATPDLVISDYRLREQRNGLDAIAALRELLGAALPALLITGDTAPDRLRDAQKSGIPLLHKPVSSGQLFNKLVTILPQNVA